MRGAWLAAIGRRLLHDDSFELAFAPAIADLQFEAPRARWRETLAGYAAVWLALGGPAVLWSVQVGLLIAPVAGVVALPGEVLSSRSRSTGFGLFYTLFYAGMGLAPVVAGYLVDRRGGSAALWLAAALWLLALPALWLFRVLQRRWAAADVH